MLSTVFLFTTPERTSRLPGHDHPSAKERPTNQQNRKKRHKSFDRLALPGASRAGILGRHPKNVNAR
jgi:hypothetical protein